MTKTNHILIVEDEEFLVLALKDNLEADGYTTDVARNGEEAIAHIHSHHPDLILLDLLMPKQNGLYVLEEVRKNPQWQQIPIIVLSNLGGDMEIKRALELGADDYFVKSQHPIEEVLDKVKEYLEGGKSVNPPKVGT
jgi:DNA-binding response OmpR family regulator